jgi:hypothetical protein
VTADLNLDVFNGDGEKGYADSENCYVLDTGDWNEDFHVEDPPHDAQADSSVLLGKY